MLKKNKNVFITCICVALLFAFGVNTTLASELTLLSDSQEESITVETIEFAIATHVHADHTGLADMVMENFNVKTLYTKEYNENYTSEIHRVDNQKHMMT